MNDQTYTCAQCDQTFIKGWSDGEAIAELKSSYPGFDIDDCKMICDDCYKQRPKSYKEFRIKVRNDMTEVYRKMHKDSPIMARLYWKTNKELEKKLINNLLYGVSNAHS